MAELVTTQANRSSVFLTGSGAFASREYGWRHSGNAEFEETSSVWRHYFNCTNCIFSYWWSYLSGTAFKRANSFVKMCRPRKPQLSNQTCGLVLDDEPLEKIASRPNITAENIVFVAQFPHPRSGVDLKMTRWFQQVIAVLWLDIRQKYDIEVKPDAWLTFDVRLGYRNDGDPPEAWKEIARSREMRPLFCSLDKNVTGESVGIERGLGEDFGFYDCEVMPLFTLGSCHHQNYLVNIRIPRDLDKGINHKIGVLQDVWMVEIHQNGGFTMVWFSLKTFLFPIALLTVVFFWRRVSELERSPTLMERTIFALGLVLCIFDCPVEWLSLKFDASFWLVLSDIRQGAFYATLACFWLVFTGEHLMDSPHGHRHQTRFGLSVYYWPKLLLVGGCCSAMSIFELAERGVQLHNPFYSIWSHPVAAKLGYASVILGGLCAAAYFLYLTVLVCRALWQIFTKRRLLPALQSDQRVYYSGLIYRFTALLVYTILCAALTVIFYIFSQANEERWKWGSHRIEYTSAFITGVYGMWNAYVVTILCLYAPSHKFRSSNGNQMMENLLVSSDSPGNRLPVEGQPGTESKQEDSGPTECVKLVPVHGLTFFTKTAQE
ncbi:integral membrane protein gpr177 [Echinococcus multilocularis]|uniref:Integral membrane protein gpr177 n=1 Tax=Echinococcus multilocularis TaxID=6211 RepID=A0A068YCV9_ECHMU|nr:integral membrane protein gpr177 [Echinococcus multilocularis]